MDSIEKAIRKEYNDRYCAAHRDELNAKQRQWYAEHKEYHKAWREKNRERYKAYQREYAAKHSPKTRVSN